MFRFADDAARKAALFIIYPCVTKVNLRKEHKELLCVLSLLLMDTLGNSLDLLCACRFGACAIQAHDWTEAMAFGMKGAMVRRTRWKIRSALDKRLKECYI